MSWLDDSSTYFARRGRKHLRRGDVLWYEYQSRVFQPFSPASIPVALDQDAVRGLLDETGAWIVRSTAGLRAEPSEWWYVMCDRFIDLPDMKAKERSEVKRGLQNCEVRQLSCDAILAEGHSLVRESFERYRTGAKPESEAEFRKQVEATRGLDETFQWWGVYSDGRLAGYSFNVVFGDEEVFYDTIRLSPALLKNYTAYALVHRMNEHYLSQGRVKRANDGMRSIFHETGFQSLLQKKFGFSRAYSQLNIAYSPVMAAGMTMIRPLAPLFKSMGNPVARICSALALQDRFGKIV